MRDVRRPHAVDWRIKRARPPEASGYVERDGTRVYWESFGTDGPAILLLPTWSVLHAAHGRFQIADLARRHRVITFDPRGNGRSDRPSGADAYTDRVFVADAIAVLDATGTLDAVVVACSHATQWLLRLAAEHPSRVRGAVSSGTNLPLAPAYPSDDGKVAFDEPYRSTSGWAKYNAAYWQDHYEDFLRFFFEQVWSEPHSRAVIEDAVDWGLETTPDTLVDTVLADGIDDEADVLELAARVQCPFLVIHGGDDSVTPVDRSIRLAEVTGGRLEILDGAGHCPGNREPVWFDRLVSEFVGSVSSAPPPTTRKGDPTPAGQRVLIVPDASRSVVFERDLLIAEALRSTLPDVRVEWLVPEPWATELEDRGEIVHPLSRDLLRDDRDGLPVSVDRWSYRHVRSLDETDFANFMVFHDLVTSEPPDLVVADSSRHIDHHLSENAGPKQFAYAWLADAVGWQPTADETALDADLRIDANGAIVDQLRRDPSIHDLAGFVGARSTLPAAPLGPDLPSARDLVDRHFVTVVDPVGDPDVARIASMLEHLLTQRLPSGSS